MLKGKLIKITRTIDDARFEISKMKDVPDEAIICLRSAVNDLKDLISILKSAEDFDELLIAASRIVAEDMEKELNTSATNENV